MKTRELHSELQVIASEELAGVLEGWQLEDARRSSWTPAQRIQLACYLRDEMGYGGMLSVEKARDAGQSLGLERAQGRRLLAWLEAHALPETDDGTHVDNEGYPIHDA